VPRVTEPLSLRTWIFVRSLGTGDVLAAPLASPDSISVGPEEEAILEQKLALPEHLGGEAAQTVARFSFPEGTELRAVDVVVPREDLPKKLAIHAPIAIAAVVVPAVPLTVTRPNEREARVRFEGWVFVLPMREICHVVVDERFDGDIDQEPDRVARHLVDKAIEARVRAEVKRLWIARDADAYGWLGLLPARRQRLVPLDLSLPRGDDGPEARADALRKALADREKRARAVEILNSVGRPLHLARRRFIGEPAPLVGRDRERALLTALLSATRDGDRQGICLVGRERVGKSALLHAWLDAQLTLTQTGGESPLAWSTSGAALIAGMSGLGQWQERVRRVMQAAADLDAVLVLDDLADLFSERGRSTVDVPSAMRPFLEQGRVRFVAELHEDRLDRMERQNAGFFATLSKIRLPPLDEKTTHEALAARAKWDLRHADPKIPVEDSALAAIVDLAERHLAYESFPGKAIRLYEEVRAAAASASSTPKPISKEQVHEVVSLRTGVPTFLLRDDRALAIDEVIDELRARVIGQDEAVRRVAEVVAVVKAGLQPRGKPLATFLFVGPTGVGKTELARALAEFLFGATATDQDRLLRFDMSEFMDPLAAERLIRGTGDESGRGEGLLTRAIRRQPFAVLLLDEIEKAHPRVLDLLLQLAGEGRLTDAAGRTAYFHDAIVILTSNLGAAERRAKVGFDREAQGDEGHYERAARQAFRPEMLNRLDRIVTFRDLGKEHRKTLVSLSIEKVRRRRGLFENGTDLRVSEGATTALADGGYSFAYGARALRRHVEEHLVEPAATLMSGYGGTLDIDVDVRLESEPQVLDAPSEVHGGLRFALVRRAQKSVSHEHGAMRRIAAVRRELARAGKLDRLVELREHLAFLVAQLGTGAQNAPDYGREQGRLQAEHFRLSAPMTAVDRAISDVQVVEETAIEAFFRGEKLGELLSEAERIRREVARPLVRALVAQEPRRDEVTLLVQELDNGRALDVWLRELVSVLEDRGWTMQLRLQETDAATKARKWGDPRDHAFALQLLRGDRTPMSLVITLTGSEAMLASLERGVQRFVGLGEGPAHLAVHVIALRSMFTPEEWKKIEPETPQLVQERLRHKPSRIHDRAAGKVSLAGLSDLEIPRAWEGFDEIALAILLGFEKDIGDRDEAFAGRLSGDDEIAAILANGGKIMAIKRYRELTGVGLKEAKDAVEALEARLKERAEEEDEE
jgi:ATP-dependent Clp protease ATP-binding subunit ClpC